MEVLTMAKYYYQILSKLLYLKQYRYCAIFGTWNK